MCVILTYSSCTNIYYFTHPLAEKPTAFGTLADLTCDSDGKIDRFITTGTEDTKSLLELHVPEPDKPYLLGMFLVCKNMRLDFL